MGTLCKVGGSYCMYALMNGSFFDIFWVFVVLVSMKPTKTYNLKIVYWDLVLAYYENVYV